MPLKDIRICPRCNTIRWAPCFIGCMIQKVSWVENLQDGAGTFEPELPSTAHGAA